MPAKRLPRLVLGIEWFDEWIDTLVTAIEASLNITATPPLAAFTNEHGINLALLGNSNFVIAKSGSSGIPAMSGSTPGFDTVTLWDITWGTSAPTIATQTTTEKAVNLGSNAVGNNVMLVCVRVKKWLVVVTEFCP